MTKGDPSRNDKQKQPLPPEELARLFELLRSGNRSACHLFGTLFRERVRRQVIRTGIPDAMFNELYHDVVLGVWFSASKLSGPDRLPRHVAVVTRKITRHFIGKLFKGRRCPSEIKALELIIRSLGDQPDPGLPAKKKESLRLLAELRRSLRRAS